MNAIYFVVDEDLADLASAAALQISTHWDCDVHVFIERRDTKVPITEVGGGRIVYHFERLSGYLPEGLPETEQWPRIVYLRMFAPRALTGYRRLLYLDADILAFGTDTRLWDVPLPTGLGAVTDIFFLEHGPHNCDRDEWLASIGVHSGRYFNSGVLLIDPQIWNRIDFEGLLQAFFAQFPDAMHPDQDFLAHIFDARWTELSPRFNWSGAVLSLGLTRAVAPVFIHFNGMDRPWHGRQAPWVSRNDPAHVATYERVLRNAGFDPRRYRKAYPQPSDQNARRMVRATLRRWIGIHDARAAKVCTKWAHRHAILRSFIEQGLSENRFAAERLTRLDVAKPRPVWNGNYVRVVGDHPPGPLFGPIRGATRT